MHRTFLEVDDLTPAEFARRPRHGREGQGRPVEHPAAADRAGRGPAVREAVGPHARVHRDGRRQPRRSPDLRAARGGGARRARDRSPTSPAPSPGSAPCSRRGCSTTPRSRRWRRSIDIPVVNLLSDRAHPTQAVADFLTLRELLGTLEGRRLAYIGDGNNVTASLAYAAALSGVELAVASPPGTSSTTSRWNGSATSAARIELGHDPYDAVAGADAVYTDVWTSMGQEEEAALAARRVRRVHRRRRDAALRPPDAWFLHCLPAHRGEEVAASVIDGPRSAVWQQAANRMHAARAVLTHLDRTDADGHARQAAAPAPHRAAARGAGDLQPGATGRDARRRRRDRHAGDGEPRPRGARRGQGAHPRRRDGLRHPRARQGAHRARRPPPTSDGGVRGGGRAQREPRGAADAPRFRPRRRLGARPGRSPRRARHGGGRRHDHPGVLGETSAARPSPPTWPPLPVSRTIADDRRTRRWPSEWCSRTPADSTRRWR